jgi:hypothetical protein
MMNTRTPKPVAAVREESIVQLTEAGGGRHSGLDGGFSLLEMMTVIEEQ